MSQKEDENTNARRAWNTNAEFWDQRMVEGNDFFNVLVWPAVEKLLRPSEGDRLLDVACGNGVTSRRLANAKARVTAFDFLQPMIDLALCNMALMDMADIEPLMNALASLLRPNGRFVFSVLHPCFNNPATVQMGELEDRAGTFTTTYSVKISCYLTPYTQAGIAMHG